MKRLLLALTVGALCSLGLVTPALAATPGNDTYAARTVVGTLPFSDVLDTTEATTDSLDAEAALGCGAPATDASVWYEHTPATDGDIIVDANESDYAVGIQVLVGSPGDFSFVGCASGGLATATTAGETLTILIFDYDGDGNGGNLVLAIEDAPPPPSFELSLEKSGSIDQRTGVATVKGTITCTGGDEYGKYFLEVRLTQMVGRFRISAWGAVDTFACDGTAEAFEIQLIGENGRLGGGKATVSIFAVACTYACYTVEVEQVITLRR